MLKRLLHDDNLWELLPEMEPVWSGELAHGEPHGGGVLRWGRPRDTITGTLNHGCLDGPYIRYISDSTVKLVRDKCYYNDNAGYLMEV